MFSGDAVRIFIIFILLMFHNATFACSGHGKAVEQHFERALKVFRGRIVSSQPVNVENDDFHITHEVTILTSVSFKGEVALLEKAYIEDSASSCGINIDEEEWLFYINTDNYTGQLTGTFKLTVVKKQSGEVVSVTGEPALTKLKKLAAKKT